MVENLLSVTRINESASNLKKSPEAAEEVIGEAIARIKQRFPQRQIAVHVPNELLEVPMDGTLIVQVLINLLENAIKFSPEEEPVEVSLRRDGEWARFEVLDRGKGISKDILLNDMPADHRSADSARGMGIGLSICRTILNAHHGKLDAENRGGGGAVFTFVLPIKGED